MASTETMGMGKTCVNTSFVDRSYFFSSYECGKGIEYQPINGETYKKKMVDTDCVRIGC